MPLNSQHIVDQISILLRSYFHIFNEHVRNLIVDKLRFTLTTRF
jgi:hypothetical protein